MLARYGHIQPSEFYAMSEVESAAWEQSLAEILEAEEEKLRSTFKQQSGGGAPGPQNMPTLPSWIS